MDKKLPSLRILYIICGIALIVTLFTNGWFGPLLGRLFNKPLLPLWWNDVLDPVFGIGTALFAWFIWQLENKEYRLQKLPKKLTVHFKHEGKYIMSCFEAYLAGEADIRAWAQSIGQQMNNGEFLSFYPYFSLEPPITSDFRLYEVTVHLIKIPTKNTFLSTNYLAWYGNDDKTPGNQVKWFNEHPTEKPKHETVKNTSNQNPKENLSFQQRLEIKNEISKLLNDQREIMERQKMDINGLLGKIDLIHNDTDKQNLENISSKMATLEKRLQS